MSNPKQRKWKLVLAGLAASLGVYFLMATVAFYGIGWSLPPYPQWKRPLPADPYPAKVPSPIVPTAQTPTPTPSPQVSGPPASPPQATVPRCVTLDARGASPTPSLTDYGGEPFGLGRGQLEGSHPVYAPNGRELAFVKDTAGGYHIWIIGVDGRNPRQLTTSMSKPSRGLPSNQDSGPAWSPDGSQIAFASATSSGSEIWVISAGGSNVKQLTSGPAEKRRPAWSPDGSRIAFVASESRGDGRIWIMNADGTNVHSVRALSSHSWQEEEDWPVFSPFGRQLVFVLGRGSDSRLMIVNVDGTGLCELTEGFEPSWSWSGIVFVRFNDQGSGYALWLIQPDGSGLQALPAVGSQPAWSPDGTRIAYLGEDHESIFVISLRDRTAKPLTQLNTFSIIIYIKPGLANTIDPKSGERIPVAILWTPWFDPVRQIDQASISFGPTGTEKRPVSCVAEEVNQQGTLDLVCYFDAASSFSPTHTEGILKATGINGFLFEGRDAVHVLGTP